MRNSRAQYVIRLAVLAFVLSLLPLGPLLASQAARSTPAEAGLSTSAASPSTLAAAGQKKKHHKQKHHHKKKRKKCKNKTSTGAHNAKTSAAAQRKKPCPPPPPSPPPPPPSAPPRVLLAVGDIALCNGGIDEQNVAATARYIAGQPGDDLAALGDLAYQKGSPTNFQCYDQYYGPFVDRTYPAPGNHEYRWDRTDPCTNQSTNCAALAYFNYFQTKTTAPSVVQGIQVGQGWYTYTYGSWQIYVLNSNGSAQHTACHWVQCDAGSAQYQWLQTQLRHGSVACSLAYWHHPLFNSGSEGESEQVKGFWRLLYNANADLILNGHQHSYERFAPQTPEGAADPQRGIREFIVGTGGSEMVSAPQNLKPNSETVIGQTPGVLKLTLESNGYTWAFVDANTGQALDAGHGNCH
jgi:Calcineurin-like phosphoesterase